MAKQVMWAIRYNVGNGMHPYIDTETISYLRKDAWAKWAKGWTRNGVLQAGAKQRRREGLHRAIRVTIEEYVK